MSPGPRPTSLPSGILIQPFGHKRHGLKSGGGRGLCPFGEEKLHGWIKIKHGMEVGLGPGRIVLDGDPRIRDSVLVSIHNDRRILNF